MLAVADASGHGIGPALVIAETRAMLRAISLQDCDVSEVLRTANKLLSHDLEGRFVTCFLGLLDPLMSRLLYATAGHGPLLFYDRQRDEFTRTVATDLPLGIMEEVAYGQVVAHRFQPNDFAVITTDGFHEADNPAGELFGVDRVVETLRRDRDLPADQMIASLHQAVLAFTDGQPQSDDLTAIVIRRK
jgi:serine phosphatase RsbU (regulator of sigma subunit)